MIIRQNPFALVRASDYTDAQINSLWVELGPTVINAVIEPTSGTSKYILGGKGTGKTHLLRYHSYQVARLRVPEKSGLAVVSEMGYLAVFLRATALDAARFETVGEATGKWQQLFGVYLELRLAEALLDALCDIQKTSQGEHFDDMEFIKSISDSVVDRRLQRCVSIEEFRSWLTSERRSIDEAVNNAAFAGVLDVRVPFSIGSLCLPIKRAMCSWHIGFESTPLIYLLDEIENLSELQQQVVNSLIRYGESQATFRVTGRLYARKTLATIGGEENRDGAEFRVTPLDDLLKENRKYGDFAKRFVSKRLTFHAPTARGSIKFEPKSCFEEVSSENFYQEAIERLGIDYDDAPYKKAFSNALQVSGKRRLSNDEISKTTKELTSNLPIVLQKLNILQFCKKFKKQQLAEKLAREIREESDRFYAAGGTGRGWYANAYSHYKLDLFAQLCRESKKSINFPYAGFDTFVAMSSGNPRNLLIILGRAYDIASFRELDFINGPPLSVHLQILAVVESARFMFERDTNYGSSSDKAKISIERLALLLRTARYALNIPEVSPLAVSFQDSDLTPTARETLASALNYSLVFEVSDGRPDRNSERLNRKIQLNPLLSARWGLPIGRRGDLSLSQEVINTIFDISKKSEFDALLKIMSTKWNNPFTKTYSEAVQDRLF